MIKTNDYGGTFFIVHENKSVTPINEQAYNAINEQNKQLQQYKSIVKAVDPDNLPEGRVLAFNELKQGLIGDLYEHRGCIFCDDESIIGHDMNEISDVTHYIETKDIIKMMGDL